MPSWWRQLAEDTCDGKNSPCKICLSSDLPKATMAAGKLIELLFERPSGCCGYIRAAHPGLHPSAPSFSMSVPAWRELDHSESSEIKNKLGNSDAEQVSNLEQAPLPSSALVVKFGAQIFSLILYLHKAYTVKRKKQQQMFEIFNSSNNLQNY